jgi:hypothetical protein
MFRYLRHAAVDGQVMVSRVHHQVVSLDGALLIHFSLLLDVALRDLDDLKNGKRDTNAGHSQLTKPACPGGDRPEPQPAEASRWRRAGVLRRSMIPGSPMAKKGPTGVAMEA